MPYLGSMLRTVRPLDDILADLDSGPAEYRACDAARLLGVMPQTLATWRNNGRVTASPHMNTYIYSADALRRLAQDVHGVSLYELDSSDDARAAVLRMIDRWNGSAGRGHQQRHANRAAGVVQGGGVGGRCAAIYRKRRPSKRVNV